MVLKEEILLCNSCGEKTLFSDLSVKDPLSSKLYTILKCSKCGLGHTFPIKADFNSIYPNSYYGNRHGFTESYCIKRRIRRLLFINREENEKRLLDVGCGNGALIRNIRKRLGWLVAGTEINSMASKLDELYIGRCIEDVTNVAPFDYVTMWHTLEHMSGLNNILMEINKVMRKDGKLIIAVPNNNSLQARYFKNKWFHLDVPRHRFHFDDMSLGKLLNKNGFEIIYKWYQEIEYDLLGWIQSALNTMFSDQNVFFDYFRDKKINKYSFKNVMNLCLGLMLIPFSFLMVMFELILKRSGTIVVVARQIR